MTQDSSSDVNTSVITVHVSELKSLVKRQRLWIKTAVKIQLNTVYKRKKALKSLQQRNRKRYTRHILKKVSQTILISSKIESKKSKYCVGKRYILLKDIFGPEDISHDSCKAYIFLQKPTEIRRSSSDKMIIVDLNTLFKK